MYSLNFNSGRDYQNIPVGQGVETEDSVPSSVFGLPKSKFLWIGITSAVVFATLCLSLLFTSPSNAHRFVCMGAGVNAPPSSLVSLQAYPGEALKAGGYCKVQCSDPCSLFPSVYGNLCCEWSHGPDGGKSCGLHVTKDNVCACDAPASSGGDEKPHPSEPVAEPAPAPTEKKPKNHGGWEPMPWLPFEPFKPFKPIKVPDDAEPCKQQCDNPCSWSQSNGVSYCCETVPGKACSSTQINGQCFCA